MPNTEPDRDHVAVGVILAGGDQVIVARRADHLHQGGLWEFPGGKVHDNESVEQALVRELHEELAIDIHEYAPLIQIPYDYGDKQVLLDVFIVGDFSGDPVGQQGQEVQTVAIDALRDMTFPAANKGIINALMLPDVFMITASKSSHEAVMQQVNTALQNGVRLFQFRAHELDDEEYLQRAEEMAGVCQQQGALVILNTSVENFQRATADGLQLTSRELMAYQQRPVDNRVILGASIHNAEEMQKANQLGVDYALLSPVKATASHPDATPLGWERFAEITALATMPVYALGGMSMDDLNDALECGAQGIAAVSLFK